MQRFFLTFFLIFIFASARADDFVQDAINAADSKEWGNARYAAQKSGDMALVTLVNWHYFLDPDSGATFGEITSFIRENPDWPEQKKLRLRAEFALRDAEVSAGEILDWFGDAMPLSGIGKLALAEALQTLPDPPASRIRYLVRDAWRSGDFEEPREDEILARYGAWLGEQDHITRTDRLLWDEKITAARRMWKHLPQHYHELFDTRIAYMENKRTAPLALAKVTPKLRNDPGLMFERMRYYARHNDDQKISDLLIAAPAHVPYPERWWRQREVSIRQALDEGDITRAEKLLANHAQVDGVELATALWLSGWLELEFKQQPRRAYDIFYAMYDQVNFPASKARAAYWAARAAEKNSNITLATQWYEKASAWPTTFYGQLALAKRFGEVSLRLPAEPSASGDNTQPFEDSLLTRAIVLSAKADDTDMANRLLTHIMDNPESSADTLILAAQLGARIGYPVLSVRASKKALQRGLMMMEAGYPRPSTPTADIERALILAIIRQESEFNPRAISPSNALGMMQLLPSTAKEVAKKNDLPYEKNRLFEPDYNMTLGSLYLGRLIEGYNGSYIMGIAAYNAGPGNVRKWIAVIGTPQDNVDDAVNWIEKIPYYETRNYVQRVLENVQVYRALEAGSDPTTLKLAEDLVR